MSSPKTTNWPPGFGRSEAYHLQGNATVRAVVEAIQRSHMFIQEDEQNLLGRARSMIGFRHELIGKYLAACHLLPLPHLPRARHLRSWSRSAKIHDGLTCCASC